MGNKSSVTKREGESDLDFCDQKFQDGKMKKLQEEDDDEEEEQVEKLDPILSSLNYDVISEVVSFLDVKNQLLVCSSSKILFNEFIGTASYNKHFYMCATKHAIPSLHDTSLLDHLFKRLQSEFHRSLKEEDMIVKFNRLWRKFLSVIVESQSFKFNSLPNVVCEEDDYLVSYQREGHGNYTISMAIPQNITDAYDSSSEEKHFLLNFEIVKKEANRNICIGMGDKEVLEMNCTSRFLGFPDNSLSYSSDGSMRYKIIESLRDEFYIVPYNEGDIISMLIRYKPYTKGKEVFYSYQVNFFNNGHYLPYPPGENSPFPPFDSLCPLYPSFTLHSNGDSLRVLFSKKQQVSNPKHDHKTLERIFAFLLKYHSFS